MDTLVDALALFESLIYRSVTLVLILDDLGLISSIDSLHGLLRGSS